MSKGIGNFNLRLTFYASNTTGATQYLLMVKFPTSVTVVSPPPDVDLVSKKSDGTVWLFGKSSGWADDADIEFDAIVGYKKSLGKWAGAATSDQWGIMSDVIYKWSNFYHQRTRTSDKDMYDPAELEG